MYQGRIVFSQIMDYLPDRHFKACVNRYRGDHRIRTFTCLDQFYCMSFAQLTGRESLRDIETCLRAVGAKLYHAGMKTKFSYHLSQGQRTTRLANLSRYSHDSDRSGTHALCRSISANESQTGSLCSRFHGDRFWCKPPGAMRRACGVTDVRSGAPKPNQLATLPAAANASVDDELAVVVPSAMSFAISPISRRRFPP